MVQPNRSYVIVAYHMAHHSFKKNSWKRSWNLYIKLNTRVFFYYSIALVILNIVNCCRWLHVVPLSKHTTYRTIIFTYFTECISMIQSSNFCRRLDFVRTLCTWHNIPNNFSNLAKKHNTQVSQGAQTWSLVREPGYF